MSCHPSPSTSPMARPAPLCATALVKDASPSSVFVKWTPVADGSMSVNPGLLPAIGCTSVLRNPAPVAQAARAAWPERLRQKITQRAAHFIGIREQTTCRRSMLAGDADFSTRVLQLVGKYAFCERRV